MKNKQIQLTGLGGIENLILVESPMPEPKSGEVRLKVSAAGISLAEVLMRTGHSAIRPKLPFVPGYDVVGTVDKVGHGAPKDWIGKRVAALIRVGGYSQYV
ncbi:MAG: alcohol dehydrogenase catalytic domain-containing protein, partial [Spirochaetia bacterium]|nr:alcohol dehydrogenase catalytic domain-containing protein [Spirochaetia bacterium]